VTSSLRTGTPWQRNLEDFQYECFTFPAVTHRRALVARGIRPHARCVRSGDGRGVLRKRPPAARQTSMRRSRLRGTRFERGPWRTTPPAERARLLWKLSDAIEANAAELALLETRDNGMPLWLAQMWNIPKAVDCLRYYSGWPMRLNGRDAAGFDSGGISHLHPQGAHRGRGTDRGLEYAVRHGRRKNRPGAGGRLYCRVENRRSRHPCPPSGWVSSSRKWAFPMASSIL